MTAASDSPAADLESYAAALRRDIDAALDEATRFSGDCPASLSAAMRHLLLAPGKRLRPLLVLMAGEACGCPGSRVMPAACAVEMIHTYSLIHDDLPAMDNDDLRRGLPTCHKVFGEASAILAGDALLARSFELLATRVEPPAVAVRCCAELAHAAGAEMLVGGQADDLAAEHQRGSLAELEAIHRRKTGAMFRVALRLGAVVAEAPPEQFAALDRYGSMLGLAFQIVDDILDLRGEEAAMGKRIRKDSGRGKLTFPAVLGLEASVARAEGLMDEACRTVACFGARARHLQALARYVVERNR